MQSQVFAVIRLFHCEKNHVATLGAVEGRNLRDQYQTSIRVYDNDSLVIIIIRWFCRFGKKGTIWNQCYFEQQHRMMHSLQMHAQEHMCTQTCTHAARTHTRKQTHVHIHMLTHTLACTRALVHTRTRAQAHRRTGAHAHRRTRAHAYTRTRAHTHTRTCARKHAHMRNHTEHLLCIFYKHSRSSRALSLKDPNNAALKYKCFPLHDLSFVFNIYVVFMQRLECRIRC